ncbi:MAG: hypothetical protein RBU37_16650 [Myxococcota bacterium]|jgi:hypothetical protein|nr:hypothetical protein [Myxococcota bacterium]
MEWLIIVGIGAIVAGGITMGLRAGKSIALAGERVWNEVAMPHLEALRAENFELASSFTNDAYAKNLGKQAKCPIDSNFSAEELQRNLRQAKEQWGELLGFTLVRTRKQSNLFSGSSEYVLSIDLAFERHMPRIQLFVDAKSEPLRISFSGQLIRTQTLRPEAW